MTSQNDAFAGTSVVTDSEILLPPYGGTVQASAIGKKFAVISVVLSVAAAAAAFAAQLGHGQHGVVGAPKSSTFVSRAQNSSKARKTESVGMIAGGAWSLKRSGAACSNLDAIRLGPLTQEVDAAACRQRCYNMAGCTGFIFQPSVGARSQECLEIFNHAPWIGACQGFSGECAETESSCYDIFENTANSELAWSSRADNVRCDNWKDIALGALTVTANAADCGAICMKTSGCAGFSYKRGNSYVFWKIVQGACYVYGDGQCAVYDDNDWDDYQLAQQVPTAYVPDPQLNQGCSNWESILLAKHLDVQDPPQCFSACEQNRGCVGFGFKRDFGECYLWKSECQGEYNDEWDDYKVQLDQ